MSKIALPDWLVGRTHYKTSHGDRDVTLCPKCAKIYGVAVQGFKTPEGRRFRATTDSFFNAEEILKTPNNNDYDESVMRGLGECL